MKKELILHNGCERVTREELKAVKTPKKTDSWVPVNHYNCIGLIAEEVERQGMKIIKEEYGLNSTGSKMFGVMRFAPDGNPEYSRALGIRNSHDRTLSLSIVAGVNVFVCDNLAFGGSQTIARRHTAGMDIDKLIPEAFEKLNHKFIRLEKDIGKLKLEIISVDDARILTCISAELGYIRPADVVNIVGEFKEPRHEEFSEPSKWSLYNSFTEIAKKYSPAKADKCYRGLARMFNLAGE